MSSVKEMLDKIGGGLIPSLDETVTMLKATGSDEELIYAYAQNLTRQYHGDEIFLRGLIEYSNICTNNCHYCGIRAANQGVNRYRMSTSEIYKCAEIIRASNCGTVVLQAGIDPWYDAQRLAKLIRGIKRRTGLAVTLSIGTRTYAELALLKRAGADRCLLRFETSSEKIFSKIHPDERFEKRIECIHNIRQLNFQTGSGFMIGLPGSTLEMIARDLLYTIGLELDMIGCGPFIPAQNTPLAENTSIYDHSICYKTMALLRIMNPAAHIPAATAFDALKPGGRDEVIACGANIFMPNFTPSEYRNDYNLYSNKPQVDASVNIYTAVKKRIENMNRRVSPEAGHALRITRA